ncbi:uncharacterized protein LOC114830682 [Esox lucius]|uniref:uncharacterized protein LOC114830682 n=1 Tax=Esox lucius TaxID=8010 RepID=UPI001476E9CC|nr:uncharacterized protein LOC114830682 [Esox lucius]
MAGAVSSSQDGISGSEVELRVRPGDNVTLYCDMLLPNTLIVWYRNCSHVDQPHLVITRHKRVRDPKYLENFQSAFSRFTLVWNISKRTHDLLIENVTESDLGLYYCGTNTTIMEEGNQTEKEDFNRYGNVITRLSFDIRPESSSPPVDCGLCWILLVSLCPVSVLLSSTCVYSFCRRSVGTETQPTPDMNTNQHIVSSQKWEGDVCYASLDIRQGQKRPKKMKVENSDLSTYSAINTIRE